MTETGGEGTGSKTPARWPDTRLTALLTGLAVIAASGLDSIIPPAGIPVAVLLIWLILRMTGTRWVDLGLSRPGSWKRTIVFGIGIAAAWLLISNYVLEPLLGLLGIAQDKSQFAVFLGNKQMLAMFLLVSWTTAGFGEELIWRGFLLPRLARVLGGSKVAWAISVLLAAVLFGLMHLRFGVHGVISTALVAVSFGIIYLTNGRNLWMLYVAHATLDTVAFIQLYTGIGV